MEIFRKLAKGVAPGATAPDTHPCPLLRKIVPGSDTDAGKRPQRPFQRLSSSALVITLTELIAIAAPATTGFR